MRRVIVADGMANGVHVLLENEEEKQCVKSIVLALCEQLEAIPNLDINTLKDIEGEVATVCAINDCGIFEIEK